MAGHTASIAEIAALVGNPARANTLLALLDGRALTATELSAAAGVSPQTTSGHLSKMTEAGLLALTRQGRHAYYRLASPSVGRMLESLMTLTADQARPPGPAWRGGEELRTARTCYDHLAGRLGVALADSLTERNLIALDQDGGLVTPTGESFLRDFGIDPNPARRVQRAFCRPCLDWSERRFHLAGALGTSLASRCLDLGWTVRPHGTRAVTITEAGARGFAATFGIDTAAFPNRSRQSP